MRNPITGEVGDIFRDGAIASLPEYVPHTTLAAASTLLRQNGISLDAAMLEEFSNQTVRTIATTMSGFLGIKVSDGASNNFFETCARSIVEVLNGIEASSEAETAPMKAEKSQIESHPPTQGSFIPFIFPTSLIV